MQKLQKLLEKNREWARGKASEDPEFFTKLARGQKPKYLWIGCADSRVAVTNLLNLEPGSIFVHRNIANIVSDKDLNCLSVMEYAIDSLKIEHVIICGHYGCGGVQVALDMFAKKQCCDEHSCHCENIDKRDNSLLYNWLQHIIDVKQTYNELLSQIADKKERFAKLCELNVLEQLKNCCKTSIVQNAWERGQSLTVHAFIYDLSTGLLNDFQLDVKNNQELAAILEVSAVVDKLAEFKKYGKN